MFPVQFTHFFVDMGKKLHFIEMLQRQSATIYDLVVSWSESFSILQ